MKVKLEDNTEALEMVDDTFVFKIHCPKGKQLIQ